MLLRPMTFNRRHCLRYAGWSALTVASGLTSGCGVLFPKKGSLRYCVSIEMYTPSGIRRGSGVLESRNEAGASGSLRMLQNPRAECFGEAVVTDLGDGRQVYALRQDPRVNRRIYDLVQNMLAYPDAELRPPLRSHPRRGNWTKSYPEAKRVKPFAVIHRIDYPMLVTFRDPADPQTVIEVDPDNASATLGPGYGLSRVTVQVTGDPMTDGVILQWLPWLTTLSTPTLVPLRQLNDHGRPLAHSLGTHAFRLMS